MVALDDGGRGPGHEAEGGDEEEDGIRVQLAEEAEIKIYFCYCIFISFLLFS